MLGQVLAAYTEAVLDTDRDKALAVVNDGLAKGISAEEILFDVVLPSIERMMNSLIVGEGMDAPPMARRSEKLT